MLKKIWKFLQENLLISSILIVLVFASPTLAQVNEAQINQQNINSTISQETEASILINESQEADTSTLLGPQISESPISLDGSIPFGSSETELTSESVRLDTSVEHCLHLEDETGE